MKWDSWSFESALQRSAIKETDKHDITLRWYRLDDENEFEMDEIEYIQKYIIDNLPDPILNGDNYGQNDILRKLKSMGL
jgi:hypothetical protein